MRPTTSLLAGTPPSTDGILHVDVFFLAFLSMTVALLPATDVVPTGCLWFHHIFCCPSPRLRPALAHSQHRRHLSRPLYLNPTTVVGIGIFYLTSSKTSAVIVSFSDSPLRHGVQRILVPIYACQMLATPRVPLSAMCPCAWEVWCGASSILPLSVYACLVLPKPMRAFVHDVSPCLSNPTRCFVNTFFFPAHHCAHD